MELNLNSISVDENGRVSFSGLSSGIDFEGVVDSIIAARSVPVDLLEFDVADRTDQITALAEFKSLLTSMRDSLNQINGSVSFENANDIFEAKEAFASTSRTDGSLPSAAAQIIGVTLTNSAVTGTHTMEVLRTAQAHKVSSGAVNSLTTTLGTALSVTDGSFSLEGTTINVFANDTLGDLRDRINAANTGSSATGVAASIVTVSTTENYLVLTSSDAGAANTITLGTEVGGVLSSLGLSTDGGTTLANELQQGLDARMKADGLKDLDRFETDTLSSATALLSTFTTNAPATGSFIINVGGTPQTINYNSATDTLTTLKDAINTAFGSSYASIDTDPFGTRLVIDGGGSAVTTTDTNGLLAELGLDNDQVITRSNNTITDLFAGTTINLFQAEQGTSIKIDVEQDLNAAKSAITGFVDAYNAVRVFINEQNLATGDGLKSEDSGPLFGSNVLAQTVQNMTAIIGGGAKGVGSDFSILAQIGIGFIDEADITDDSLRGTLVFETSVGGTGIDEALLKNPTDVRKLFSFDFSTSNPQVSLLNFSADTAYSAAGFTININPSTATNQFLHSEDLDNAYWSLTNSTLSANGLADPNGNTTAEGLIADATVANHLIKNTAGIAVTSGNSYTYSTYVKAGAHTQTRLNMAGANFASNSYVDVNLSTGTVVATGSGADNVLIEDAGNGWYRVNLTATATGTGNADFETYARDATLGLNFAGDGVAVDLWAWGAQLEETPSDTVTVAAANPTRATVVAAAGTAPDGTNTAEGIDASAVNDTHFVASDSQAIVSGEKYTFVTYAKAGDQPMSRIKFAGASFSTTAEARIDLSNGTVFSQGAGLDGLTVEDTGSGWYRITASTTATATGNGTVERYSEAAGGATFTGDGNGATYDTLYWGGKLLTGDQSGGYTYSDTAQGTGPSANVGGHASGKGDGTATMASSRVTVVSGDATGLELFFNGNSTASATVNYTVGVASQMFFAIDKLLASDGVIESEIDVLSDQNDVAGDRIEAMLDRLARQRQRLIERFIAMETALATSNQLLDTIKQTTDAMQQSNQ